MPYIDGKRVSQEEWIARYSSLKVLHTGPNGENPAPEPELDPETGAPPVKSKRTKRTSKATKAAIADAMGVKADDPSLADLDVTLEDA